jgi:hypothetical protein
MDDYIQQISGWLMASGTSLIDFLPAGTGLYREVAAEADKYWTGYVSTAGGSFKQPGRSGNWYGTSFAVTDAEVQPTGFPIYELSRLNQGTPVWNMHRLPQPFLSAIAADGNLQSGQFTKSQFVVECLQTLDGWTGVSGVYFPSRRADGGVVILNPQVVSIEIVYTGRMPPAGLN